MKRYSVRHFFLAALMLAAGLAVVAGFALAFSVAFPIGAFHMKNNSR